MNAGCAAAAPEFGKEILPRVVAAPDGVDCASLSAVGCRLSAGFDSREPTAESCAAPIDVPPRPEGCADETAALKGCATGTDDVVAATNTRTPVTRRQGTVSSTVSCRPCPVNTARLKPSRYGVANRFARRKPSRHGIATGSLG